MNPLNLIDFYKADHRSQYPTGTECVFSNLTARKSRLPEVDKIVFFGLQYFIKEYLINNWKLNFFEQPKDSIIKGYKRRIENALGPNAITYKHIEDLYDLGYLPIEIKALPEGSLVPIRIPSLVLFNTKPEFFWLTNYFETILSATIWGPCTSATIAYQYRKLLNKYADETVGNRDFVQWQGHDFSMRGMFGLEAACMSGAGHLLSFTGTDTVPAIDFLEEYYGANSDKELIGGSVPASEHSVVSLGIKENEIETFKRLMFDVYPKGIVSLVSDTWDFWQVITKFIPELKDRILAREGKVVIRPDTGDPVKIICGDPDAKTEWERKGAIECLWDTFGGTLSPNGYKVLDGHIGLIYGDSITLQRAKDICEGLKQKQFASTNVVLGIGSYTYQYNTRDTFGFAMKATYGEVNGEARNIFKDPKTDDGTKKSAKGLLAVYSYSDKVDDFFLLEEASWHQVNNCELRTVFKNGVAYNEQTLSQIRKKLLQG